MIKTLTDVELLNYLMTSDSFDEGLTPDEFKFLLIKFKYFYRLSLAKNEQIGLQIEKFINDKNEWDQLNQNKINILLVEIASIKDKIHLYNNRDLTFKERWKGKLIEKINI